jgi:hypothetical protein
MNGFEAVQEWVSLEESEFDFAKRAVVDRLTEDENIDDVMVGSAYLAARRAGLFGRPPGTGDLEFALSIFTLYPFKPDPPDEVERELVNIRRLHFQGLRSGNVESLDSLVPEETLRLSLWQLYARQGMGVSEFLNP